MRAPIKRNARVAPGAIVETKQQANAYSNLIRRTDQAARPFPVIISVWGRRKLWANYHSREDAAAQISKLRRFGFDAFLADEREVQS